MNKKPSTTFQDKQMQYCSCIWLTTKRKASSDQIITIKEKYPKCEATTWSQQSYCNNKQMTEDDSTP
jgi:hypothetical protein